MNQARGNTQIIRGQRLAPAVTGDPKLEFGALMQEKEATLGAGNGERRIDQGGQQIAGREGGLHGACQFHHGAQPGDIVTGHSGLRELRDEPVQAGVIRGIDQPVRVGDTEVDAVGRVEPPLADTLVVDKDAIAALEVLD